MLEMLREKVRCTVCFEVYDDPYRYRFQSDCSDSRLNLCSLDCRHVFCGLCVASWFASTHSISCPVCHVDCVARPQRDFALRDILSLISAGLGQEAQTVGNLDPAIYARIYSMIEECEGYEFTNSQLTAFWAPVVAEVRRMQGLPVIAAPSPIPPPVADVDIEMDGTSVWGSGLGVGSEVNEVGERGEAETGGMAQWGGDEEEEL